jgi:CHAD domain-containing protein
MRKAETSLATPDLHRWRKSVKNLWHLLVLARARLPKKGRRVAERLDRLGEMLGSDNDHALLAEKLALSPTGDPKLMSQLGVIARQRNALEAEAFALAKRVYVRRPKAFARRFKVR